MRSIVADWGDRVSRRLAAVSLGAIGREVAARAEQLATGSGRDVLTSATRGVSYEPPPWIRSIVIVPTVAMRPYIVPVELRDTVVFVCSVADEAFEADPSAPPHGSSRSPPPSATSDGCRILRLLRGGSPDRVGDRGPDGRRPDQPPSPPRDPALGGLLAIRDEGLVGWRTPCARTGWSTSGRSLAYLRTPPG